MISSLSEQVLGYRLYPATAELAEGDFFKFLFEELIEEVKNKDTIEALLSTEEGNYHLIFLMNGFAKDKILKYNSLNSGQRRAAMREHLVVFLNQNPLKKDFYKHVHDC